MGKNFIYNVRCNHCDHIYLSDSFLPARHYSAFDSYRCPHCGENGFYGISEIKTISYQKQKFKWYKPTTWFKKKVISWSADYGK